MNTIVESDAKVREVQVVPRLRVVELPAAAARRAARQEPANDRADRRENRRRNTRDG